MLNVEATDCFRAANLARRNDRNGSKAARNHGVDSVA